LNARETLKHSFFKEYFELSVSKLVPVSDTADVKKSAEKENIAPPIPVVQPNQTYIKQKEVMAPSHAPVTKNNSEKIQKSDHQKRETDQSDSQSTSSNSNNSVTKKAAEERFPVGMRRKSKKDYKINSYGSKNSLSKVRIVQLKYFNC
jgi:hypothetical protein